jgi:hypothetical protein
MHTTRPHVRVVRVTNKLPPLLLIVTEPVERLTNLNVCPSVSVVTSGSVTVCVVVPVKYCCCGDIAANGDVSAL